MEMENVIEGSLKKYINIQTISNEDLIELIKFEQELRYSKHFQKLYTKKNVLNDPIFQKIRIEDIIQLNVLDKFDYELYEENLNALRYLYGVHRKNPEINKYGFWLNMNIVQEGYVENQKYKDSTLYELNGINKVSLSHLIEKVKIRNVPLIIFGGSITWPPFRFSAEDYKEFYNNYVDKAEIICVYIREAHVVKRNIETNEIESGWPIGYTNYEYTQPITIEERVNIINLFIK